jgi:putative FmdB family regulatory protein
MPIYEYRCRECGCEIERFINRHEPEPTECKDCGGKMERVISQSTFHLKGDGWTEKGEY